MVDFHGVRAVVEAQYGAVSRAQLRSLGCSASWVDRQIDRGLLSRTHPGVYTIVGGRQLHYTALAAVLLYCGAAGTAGDEMMSTRYGVAAGGRSALALHGVVDVPWPQVPEIVTTFPRRKRSLGNSARVVCRSGFEEGDIVLHRALPVTSPERSIIDAADVLHGHLLEDALDSMLRNGITTLRRVGDRMRRCEPRGRTGFGRLADFVRERDPATAPTESQLEDAFMRIARSLPGGSARWRRQAPIHGTDGSVARVDFVCADRRLVVETDGWRWHGSRRGFDHDAKRRREIVLAGYRVLVFTWSDIMSEPEKVRRQLATALEL